MNTVVVDTSTLLDRLPFVQQLFNEAQYHNVEILLAREVLEELDRIKDRHGVSKLAETARAAIDWIGKSLSFQDPTTPVIRGQKTSQKLEPDLHGDAAILDCAMYNKQQKGKNTWLLSEDKNLCNRARLDGIPVFRAGKSTVQNFFESLDSGAQAHPGSDDDIELDVEMEDSAGAAEKGQNEIPAPIEGGGVKHELMSNISNLLDWHLRQNFDEDELRYLGYTQPTTSRGFAEVLAKYAFCFDAKLPKSFLEKFDAVSKQSKVNKDFVDAHVALFKRLARNDHRYLSLLHKHDRDAMTDC